MIHFLCGTDKKIAMKSLLISSLLILACIVGCGKNVPLGGKVTFSDDQTPLTKGIVCFQNGGFTARGPLKEDGTYVVGSEKAADGLPPGEYQIYITGAVEGSEMTGDLKRLIDKKWEDPSSSGATLNVTGSTKTHDFSVDRYTSK